MASPLAAGFEIEVTAANVVAGLSIIGVPLVGWLWKRYNEAIDRAAAVQAKELADWRGRVDADLERCKQHHGDEE